MGLREERTHVTIFITDGSSSDIEETMHQANFLHDVNIYQVYAAGFGDVNYTELSNVVTSLSLYFFNSQPEDVALQLLEEKIINQLCQSM